jgi:MFS family permease
MTGFDRDWHSLGVLGNDSISEDRCARVVVKSRSISVAWGDLGLVWLTWARVLLGGWQGIFRFFLGVGAGGVYPISAALASRSSHKVKGGEHIVLVLVVTSV